MAKKLKDILEKREQEDEKDVELQKNLQKGGYRSSAPQTQDKAPDTEQLRKLIAEATQLIQQLNNHYKQYTLGVQNNPPTEDRSTLEQIIQKIKLTPKNTPTLKFSAQSTINQFITYKNQWDKMMLDLESGKIQRIIKPNKKIIKY